MSGISRENKHRLKKQMEYRKRYLPYKTYVDNKKRLEVRYDYRHGLQSEVLKLLYRVGKANKIAQNKVGIIVGAKTRMPNSNFEYARRGTAAWALWELEAICKTFGIRLELKMPDKIGDRRFSVKTEGSNGEYLILSSSNCPRFHITFRKDNLYDFHVDFSEDRHLAFLFASQRTWNAYYKHVKDICVWYFKRKSGKTKMPFNMQKFETLFKLKFLNNETNHKPINSTKDEAFWDSDMDDWFYEDEEHVSFLKLPVFEDDEDEDNEAEDTED